MSRYGLKKAPRARKKKSAGVFAWLLLLGVAGLIGWIWWQAAHHGSLQTAATNAGADSRLLVTNRPIVANPRPINVPTNRPAPIARNLPGRLGAVQNFFEAQVALARQGISPGCIDGSGGSQTRSALRAFQGKEGLPATGDLDLATKARLLLTEPACSYYIVTASDLQNLAPVPDTWLGKSSLTSLGYENLVELIAEKSQASIAMIRSLNPQLEWSQVPAGTLVKTPWVMRAPYIEKAAFVRILLRDKVLEAFGPATNLLAHFPCSIAKKVEKRPIGRLTVAKIAFNPNYVFDPAIFPESAEARAIDHKLLIPPGPNNPVGVAWIGLDKPGYGIHGTPKPEQIGRTESHGCFRLANWNAEYLAQMVWAGMPVYVEP